jgi:fused signal recognition particle receptor
MLKRIFGKKDSSNSGEHQAVEGPADETAEAASSEQSEATAEAAEPSGEEHVKKGFFKSAWETTKKIAMTPVDPWFEAVAKGLDKTRQGLVHQVASLLRFRSKIDEELWDDLEDILITSDVGTEACDKIMQHLRKAVKTQKITEPPKLFEELKNVLTYMIELPGSKKKTGDQPEVESPDDLDPLYGLNLIPGRLNVILMVGVNGTGKTTTTAKIAHRCKQKGFKVILGAADTFRAAAIEQLEVWGQRLEIDVIRHQEGSDPAAVVYDSLNAAKARKADVLIIDTAGRLQAKTQLMEELAKIRRVIGREIPEAPHEVLLVLDATTGQNGLVQAKIFHAAAQLSGLVLCKLDGTAKGGIVLAIAQEFGLPVKFIGVGEGIDDLKVFQPQPFLDALFGDTVV